MLIDLDAYSLLRFPFDRVGIVVDHEHAVSDP